ncbi:MAG: hypothetical protein PUE22_03320 [Roseburia porci]|nr:hypothetical protein [Roseburia porci]MCI5517926.1 hypothetical protein [Roseburia sp.]MDD6742524.1 hypothetical protein [Roseburia porci]
MARLGWLRKEYTRSKQIRLEILISRTMEQKIIFCESVQYKRLWMSFAASSKKTATPLQWDIAVKCLFE